MKTITIFGSMLCSALAFATSAMATAFHLPPTIQTHCHILSVEADDTTIDLQIFGPLESIIGSPPPQISRTSATSASPGLRVPPAASLPFFATASSSPRARTSF